ncbi:MAG: hypothetical protein ABW007_00690 [Chitinophagaceae bacterium]
MRQFMSMATQRLERSFSPVYTCIGIAKNRPVLVSLFTRLVYQMSFKPNIPQRIVILSKDVENLTGRSKRAAQSLLQLIRKKLGKEKYHYITIAEFCEHTGIKEEQVREAISRWG